MVYCLFRASRSNQYLCLNVCGCSEIQKTIKRSRASIVRSEQALKYAGNISLFYKRTLVPDRFRVICISYRRVELVQTTLNLSGTNASNSKHVGNYPNMSETTRLFVDMQSQQMVKCRTMCTACSCVFFLK